MKRRGWGGFLEKPSLLDSSFPCIDRDVLEHFPKRRAGWQDRINDALPKLVTDTATTDGNSGNVPSVAVHGGVEAHDKPVQT